MSSTSGFDEDNTNSWRKSLADLLGEDTLVRDTFMDLTNSLGIVDERDDVINSALQFYNRASQARFFDRKGPKSQELIEASCMYLSCREKNLAFLLVDFSSILHLDIYKLAYVYLQLSEVLHIGEDWNYEKLLDPSIFIPGFLNCLLEGKDDAAVVKTARDIIANMNRDWMQTGRKLSEICREALQSAAVSHGYQCSVTEMEKAVESITKRFVTSDNPELEVDEGSFFPSFIGNFDIDSPEETIVRKEFKDLTDALGIVDERNDVIEKAFEFVLWSPKEILRSWPKKGTSICFMSLLGLQGKERVKVLNSTFSKN